MSPSVILKVWKASLGTLGTIDTLGTLGTLAPLDLDKRVFFLLLGRRCTARALLALLGLER